MRARAGRSDGRGTVGYRPLSGPLWGRRLRDRYLQGRCPWGLAPSGKRTPDPRNPPPTRQPDCSSRNEGVGGSSGRGFASPKGGKPHGHRPCRYRPHRRRPHRRSGYGRYPIVSRPSLLPARALVSFDPSTRFRLGSVGSDSSRRRRFVCWVRSPPMTAAVPSAGSSVRSVTCV